MQDYLCDQNVQEIVFVRFLVYHNSFNNFFCQEGPQMLHAKFVQIGQIALEFEK